MTVRWTNGVPPYELLLVPVFNTPTQISVSPSSSNGSFSFPLGLAAGQQFLLTMSDATGFASGGVSTLLTVGSSISHRNCSTAVPSLKFTFMLDQKLQQCGGYGNATQPVTISGLIPNETPIQLHPPSGPSSFVWNPVSVAAGTQIIFFITDADGDFGGTSHIVPVATTSDQTCLNDQSPHPATNTPTPIPVSPIDPTSAPQATVTLLPKSSNSGTIGGAIAGALVALLVLGTLIVFIYRQKKTRRRRDHRLSNRQYIDDPPSTTNLTHPPSPWNTSTDYIAEPFRMSTVSVPPSAHISTAPSVASGPFLTPNPWSAPSDISTELPSPPPHTRTSTSSKSQLGANYQRPARFILHTDAEIEDVEEIELPPQYSDRFRPTPPS
ncbi:hypothetical protein Clacol_003630 [Clathrus columnatus]|uniref:Uncharacterized protein n=1 Tax=Clathrus columnatus TaxID=1419009 RepID=A0AAV5A7G8_9AGAM|nr:hypothetical protein Clacol_003630 [Clathrus columnatus]